MDELDKIAFDAARNLNNFRFKELEENKLRVWERLDTMSKEIAENKQEAAQAVQVIDNRVVGKLNQILVAIVVAAFSVIGSFYLMHVTVPVPVK